ncbi:TRAP transporter substrate-binding protein [Dankookia sp. P2]|uniref:TRAP transporter substrate-binding protein n=1 Tax=Dankookia sp. P2 TaxID=3423955 RepID=UPI003D670C6C
MVGGLAGVQQYDAHEAPFWTRRVPEITAGQVHAQIVPFDRSGIRGQEMLQLLRLGVVSFGNVLLGLAAADEPELNAIDLPLLSPDMGALRRTVTLWRPRLEALLQERYGLVLLAVYTYPPQVVFCSKAFGGLFDLGGRRIRTSSVGQSELVTALGGVPVVIPFAEIVGAMRTGVVDCAITGARSGNSIGLHEVSTHVSRLGVSWGVSVFVANQAAWDALPAERRAELRQGLAALQEEIWQAADHERQDGFDCNAGRPSCESGRPGRMTIVEESWQDDALRIKLLSDVVLPNWVQRCGGDCAAEWNRLMAPELGIQAKAR